VINQAGHKRQGRESGVGVAGCPERSRARHVKVSRAKNPEITIHYSISLGLCHSGSANLMVVIPQRSPKSWLQILQILRDLEAGQPGGTQGQIAAKYESPD